MTHSKADHIIDLRSFIDSQPSQAVEIDLIFPGACLRLSLRATPSEAAAMAPAIQMPQEKVNPKVVLDNLDKALRDYRFTHRLAANPLAQMLVKRVGSLPVEAAGTELRHLLDQAIDIISGVAPDAQLKPSTWHLEHYLHLRYRQQVQHKDIANWLGYTERHLHRLQDELVADAAEIILQRIQ